MKQFETVIICMDDTERDAPMLMYMVSFLRNAQTRHVVLLHVHNPESDPHTTSVISHSDEMILVPVTPLADMTEHTRDVMYSLAHTYLDPLPGLDWRVVLSDNPEVPEILSMAAKFDADLLVIGRHYNDGGFNSTFALTARRVTAKSTCSVLILPESIGAGIARILVPVRNSECSAIALQTAIDICIAFNSTVTALNIYRSTLTESGAHLDDQKNVLELKAQEENQLLLNRLSVASGTIHSTVIPCIDNDPVLVVLSEIARTRIDLVVIGARGRTGAAGIFLGAVTEELIRRSPVPVLAVKTKGECIDLLHALLGLLKN